MWQTNKKKSTLFLKALLYSVVMCLFIFAYRHVAVNLTVCAFGNDTVQPVGATVVLLQE